MTLNSPKYQKHYALKIGSVLGRPSQNSGPIGIGEQPTTSISDSQATKDLKAAKGIGQSKTSALGVGHGVEEKKVIGIGETTAQSLDANTTQSGFTVEEKFQAEVERRKAEKTQSAIPVGGQNALHEEDHEDIADELGLETNALDSQNDVVQVGQQTTDPVNEVKPFKRPQAVAATPFSIQSFAQMGANVSLRNQVEGQRKASISYGEVFNRHINLPFRIKLNTEQVDRFVNKTQRRLKRGTKLAFFTVNERNQRTYAGSPTLITDREGWYLAFDLNSGAPTPQGKYIQIYFEDQNSKDPAVVIFSFKVRRGVSSKSGKDLFFVEASVLPQLDDDELTTAELEEIIAVDPNRAKTKAAVAEVLATSAAVLAQSQAELDAFDAQQPQPQNEDVVVENTTTSQEEYVDGLRGLFNNRSYSSGTSSPFGLANEAELADSISGSQAAIGVGQVTAAGAIGATVGTSIAGAGAAGVGASDNVARGVGSNAKGGKARTTLGNRTADQTLDAIRAKRQNAAQGFARQKVQGKQAEYFFAIINNGELQGFGNSQTGEIHHHDHPDFKEFAKGFVQAGVPLAAGSALFGNSAASLANQTFFFAAPTANTIQSATQGINSLFPGIPFVEGARIAQSQNGNVAVRIPGGEVIKLFQNNPLQDFGGNLFGLGGGIGAGSIASRIQANSSGKGGGRAGGGSFRRGPNSNSKTSGTKGGTGGEGGAGGNGGGNNRRTSGAGATEDPDDNDGPSTFGRMGGTNFPEKLDFGAFNNGLMRGTMPGRTPNPNAGQPIDPRTQPLGSSNPLANAWQRAQNLGSSLNRLGRSTVPRPLPTAQQFGKAQQAARNFGNAAKAVNNISSAFKAAQAGLAAISSAAGLLANPVFWIIMAILLFTVFSVTLTIASYCAPIKETRDYVLEPIAWSYQLASSPLEASKDLAGRSISGVFGNGTGDQSGILPPSNLRKFMATLPFCKDPELSNCSVDSTGTIRNATGQDITLGTNNISCLAGRGQIPEPELRAFMRALTWAEGTSDAEGYFRLVGGRIITERRDEGKPFHPGIKDTLLYSKTGLNSDAFGKFQFISTTWIAWAADAGVPTVRINGSTTNEKGETHYDMSPVYQDLAVANFLRKGSFMSMLKSGNIQGAINTPEACQWASVPGNAPGCSQKNDKSADFISLYAKLLEEEKGPGGCGTTSSIDPDSINQSLSGIRTKEQLNADKEFSKMIGFDVRVDPYRNNNPKLTGTNWMDKAIKRFNTVMGGTLSVEAAGNNESRNRLAGLMREGKISYQDQNDPINALRSAAEGGFDDNIVLALMKIYDSGITFRTGSYNRRPAGTLTVSGNVSNHSTGTAMDLVAFSRSNDWNDDKAEKYYFVDGSFVPTGGKSERGQPGGKELFREVIEILKSTGVMKPTQILVPSGYDDIGADLSSNIEPSGAMHFAVLSDKTFDGSGVVASADPCCKCTKASSGPASSGSVGSPNNGDVPAYNNTPDGTRPKKYADLSPEHRAVLNEVAQEYGYTPKLDAGQSNLKYVETDPGDGYEYKLTNEAADQYLKMKEAAQKDGVEIFLKSAYRDMDEQTSVFFAPSGVTNPISDSAIFNGQNKLEAKAAYGRRLEKSAVPGWSEHMEGKAIDLNSLSESFAGDAAYSWLKKQGNAKKFGFRETYKPFTERTGNDKNSKTSYEPWHWYYEGKPTSNIDRLENKVLGSFLNFGSVSASAKGNCGGGGSSSSGGSPTNVNLQGNEQYYTPEDKLEEYRKVANNPEYVIFHSTESPGLGGVVNNMRDMIQAKNQNDANKFSGGFYHFVVDKDGQAYSIFPTKYAPAGTADSQSRIYVNSSDKIPDQNSLQIAGQYQFGEGQKASTEQLAQYADMVAKGNYSWDKILSHWGVQPASRSDPADWLRPDGNINLGMVEFVKLVKTKSSEPSWKSDTEENIARKILLNNIDNSIKVFQNKQQILNEANALAEKETDPTLKASLQQSVNDSQKDLANPTNNTLTQLQGAKEKLESQIKPTSFIDNLQNLLGPIQTQAGPTTPTSTSAKPEESVLARTSEGLYNRRIQEITDAKYDNPKPNELYVDSKNTQFKVGDTVRVTSAVDDRMVANMIVAKKIDLGQDDGIAPIRINSNDFLNFVDVSLGSKDGLYKFTLYKLSTEEATKATTGKVDTSPTAVDQNCPGGVEGTSADGQADLDFAGIMKKISEQNPTVCGTEVTAKKLGLKSNASYFVQSNSRRTDGPNGDGVGGTGCCYGAVWAGLIINAAENPNSPWAKAFPTIDKATAGSGTNAVDFVSAMKKPGASGKPYYEEAGLVFSTDPVSAPIGSIIVVDSVSPPAGDINVKTAQGEFVNYATMGFMTSEKTALGVYYPKK
jgi:LAS superfamily LD-carboxypeptidase LdcB/muramidase (phage lysozyme)